MPAIRSGLEVRIDAFTVATILACAAQVQVVVLTKACTFLQESCHSIMAVAQLLMLHKFVMTIKVGMAAIG